MEKTENCNRQIRMKNYRYIIALALIVAMVGVAELTGEKEIIFPELAALTIGFFIVDKRVWYVKWWQFILSMTIGACMGVLLVNYSPLPFVANIAIGFAVSGIMLLLMRSTLYPLISACILPILLQTESWIYPLTVFFLTSILVVTKNWMEKIGMKEKIGFQTQNKQEKGVYKPWIGLLISLIFMSTLSTYTSITYLIMPPLIVAFVEFVGSKSGFRSRPVLTVLLLFFGSLIGSYFQLLGYYFLGLPETVITLFIILVLFGIFHWLGKYFAPVGAIALIPMHLPKEVLPALPFQVLLGAVLFIAIAMIFFHKCYQWSNFKLIYCLVPHYLLNRIRKRKKIG